MRKLLLFLRTRLFEFCAVMVGMATTIIWNYVKKSKAGVILLRRTKHFGRINSDNITKRAPQENPTESQCIDAIRLDSMDYLCCPACKGRLQLAIEKQTEAGVIQGTLECLKCERYFEIKDGLANLTFPDTLAESDFQQQVWYDQRPEYDARFWFFRLGIWNLAFSGRRAVRQLIERLETKRGAAVLETSVGNGGNLSIIAGRIGKGSQLHGLDISSESLKVAYKRMRAKGVQVTLIQGNASYLPYKTAMFDAVLHVGSLNEFSEKKRAIEEMHRVAKPGAKIVICDEGLAPDREKTLLGTWILKCNPVAFAHRPPVDLVPKGIGDLKVYWVWQNTFWVIEFRKELQD